MFLHNFPDKWIILFHFPEYPHSQLTESLFYGRKAGILVQDFKADIPVQLESYTDGLILYLLEDIQSGARQMYICDAKKK